MEDILVQFDNIWNDDYFSKLAKLKQEGIVSEYTREHKKLATLVDDLSNKKIT